jgi:CheY-like chemotaxis protein
MARVLIVEDELLLLKRLSGVLAAHGHEILEAASGQAAIDQLKKSPPDLILLDMVMPDVNGWGFLDFQRADKELAKIPVIVISAYEGMALSAKTDAYLPKPVETQDLLAAIDRLAP